ncbi:hypothetical protein BGZ63DRAFT_236910 [Mariannaea sp. PMI_226]|nr:hypothetical protein BGZ63DRAFT_236910 [Mariannaea sp. PMI_226]
MSIESLIPTMAGQTAYIHPSDRWARQTTESLMPITKARRGRSRGRCVCKQCKPLDDQPAFSNVWSVAKSIKPTIPTLLTTTASLTSLYTAISIWEIAMGTGMRCSRIAGKLPIRDQRSPDPHLVPSQHSVAQKPSIEVSVIMIHIYALTTMTLHRSRRQDRYQNAVLGSCVLGAACGSFYVCHGLTYYEHFIFIVAALPTVIAAALSLSAATHASFASWDSLWAVRLPMVDMDKARHEKGLSPLSRDTWNGQRANV